MQVSIFLQKLYSFVRFIVTTYSEGQKLKIRITQGSKA